MPLDPPPSRSRLAHMGWAELVYSGQAELAHALAISKALEEERLREIKEAHAQASGAAAKPAPAAAPKQPALEVSRAELQPLPTLGKSSRDASAVLAMSSMRAEQEAKERLAEQEVCTAGTVRCMPLLWAGNDSAWCMRRNSRVP